ncbi:hypothetical protein fugu_007670 [Takifugu bimaculatus]|uniref:Uncharacterized protein n=1 Tax=Takifugu bimaculatus TaxID=433685 RepID=A0A4Z2B0T4_9TELE|nr:hypothetical protein fugu_007670 [Takifugu bimaculatus]
MYVCSAPTGPLPLFTAPNSQQKAADFQSNTSILTWLFEIVSIRNPPTSPRALMPGVSPSLTSSSAYEISSQPREIDHLLESTWSSSPPPATLCLFSSSPLFPLFPSPGRTFPISPTDPITNCFLTGSELPCSAEEAGASLLLWCDQTLRYTPTGH